MVGVIERCVALRDWFTFTDASEVGSDGFAAFPDFC
jgi:hypothetical protein